MGKGGILPLAVVAVIGGTAGLAAIVSAEANAQPSPQADRAPAFIYERSCGFCHGHNVGPIILGRGLPPQTVEYFVRHGMGAMPAFRPSEITPAELTALAEWISSAPANEREHGQ